MFVPFFVYSPNGQRPFDCVKDDIICNDDVDCSIDCYDSYGDSLPGLCGVVDPGCCMTNVHCPVKISISLFLCLCLYDKQTIQISYFIS